MTELNLCKTHQLYDEREGVWFDIYEAPGIEGRPITAEVPRQDQHPNTVRRALLAKGAEASMINDDTALKAAIGSNAPVVRRAAHAGWRDGKQLFVAHRHVAGVMGSSTVLPPECPLVGAAGQLQVCGTLEGWQALIGVAKHSTTMMVALSATFAAPLLALVGRPSFALVFFGPSRVGKSFAQLVAASALGFGREEDLPSLNATPAGLLAAALGFNDNMLPINEIGTARGPKREVYVALRDTTYALMNGQDTLRHPSWSGGGGGAASTFQVICLLSSEISPDAWAARNGEIRDDGETARLIGVPVLVPERQTIFDQRPAKLSGDALAAWEAKQFQRLRQQLPEQRGVAYREYLDFLLADIDSHTNEARRRVAEFEAKVTKPGMSPVARDIIAKFGVLFAAGVLAVQAEILPLEKRSVATAVRRACLAALAELPDPLSELRIDIGNLKERLTAGSMIDIDACPRKQLRMMHNADGFRKPRGEGEEFVIRAQVFGEWFATSFRARHVLEWLDDNGYLDHSRERELKRSNEWAQKQVSWPDGTRVRSITVYLPRGPADLTL